MLSRFTASTPHSVTGSLLHCHWQTEQLNQGHRLMNKVGPSDGGLSFDLRPAVFQSAVQPFFLFFVLDFTFVCITCSIHCPLFVVSLPVSSLNLALIWMHLSWFMDLVLYNCLGFVCFRWTIRAQMSFLGLYICLVMGAISQYSLAAADRWMQRGGEGGLCSSWTCMETLQIKVISSLFMPESFHAVGNTFPPRKTVLASPLGPWPCTFSPCLRECSPGSPVSSDSPKTCALWSL